MEHWIKRARTQLVTMALQLFDHAETEYGLLTSVVEDVNANQA
jgi:hypothetical protein